MEPARAPRDAWDWSPGERAQARMDRDARSARVAEARRAKAPDGSQITLRCDDVIDGSHHPELLFPIELFRDFVGSTVRLPKVFPRVVQATSSDLFRTDAEWAGMTALIDPYAAVVREIDQLARAMGRNGQRHSTQLDALNRQEARLRTTTLRALREKYGRTRVDRMLYEVVAHHTFVCFSDTSGDGGAAAVRTLLAQEKAAQ